MNNIAPKLQKRWTHKIAFKILSKILRHSEFLLQSAFYISKGRTCKVLPFYDLRTYDREWAFFRIITVIMS